MVVMGSVGIEFNLHIDHKEFPLLIEFAETLGDGCLALANRFDFRTGKHNAGYIGIQKFIIEPGTPVLNVDPLFHKAKIAQNRGNAF